MYNLGMQQPQNYQRQPIASNYQMPPNYMTDQQRAMQDAQMIQQQPQGLMSAAWDNSMGQYQNAYNDINDSWDNSSGLMQFAENMRNKGYRDTEQSQMPQQASLESIGYRRYG